MYDRLDRPGKGRTLLDLASRHGRKTHDRRRSLFARFMYWMAIGYLGLWFFSAEIHRPGSSSLDDVVIRGRILTEDGRPLTNEEVEVVLPASYGLSALEAKNPDRYGSETSRARATTDADGRFSISLGSWVYHVDLYRVPFTVRIPARAPALRFYVRVPGVSTEYYAIHAREGSYQTFSDEGIMLPQAMAPIASLSAREEMEGEQYVTRVTGIVELTYASSAVRR